MIATSLIALAYATSQPYWPLAVVGITVSSIARRLSGASEPGEQERSGGDRPDTAAARLAALDAAIRRTVETIDDLNQRRDALKQKLGDVMAEHPAVTLAGLTGSPADKERLQALERQRADLEAEIGRVTVAASAAGAGAAEQRREREVAQTDVLREELDRRTAALLVVGAEVERAMEHAARKLREFRDADLECERYANRLGLTVGRSFNERAIDALSAHFSDVLLPWGTSFEISATRANRKVDFVAASRRPFTPKEKE